MEMEAQASAPDFWEKADVARNVIGKTNRERAFVKPFDGLCRAIEDAALMVDLATSEPEGTERDQALQEAA